MTRYVIGIDPGVTGALALFDRDSGKLLAIKDFPHDTIVVGKSRRSVVNIIRLSQLFRIDADVTVFMEKLLAIMSTDKATGERKVKQSAVSMLSFGRIGGAVEMAAAMMNFPITRVEPLRWKRAMSCPTDKPGARARASQLFPEFHDKFKRVVDHGRAEAAIVGLYGCRILSGKMTELWNNA